MNRLSKTRFLGVCYYPSKGKRTVPNIVAEDVFYIEIILAGEVLYDEGHGQLHLRRGTILWHQGHDETIWRTPKPDGDFTSFAIRFLRLDDWPRPGHIGQWNDLETLDDFVVSTMRSSFASEIDKDILGDYLLCRLHWEFYASSVQSQEARLPLPLVKAIALLQDDREAPETISALAHAMKLSEAHLHALFRRHLGVSPHQYLLRMRMRRARVLLSATDHPIKAIAGLCGFQSIESFHRVFRNETGMTPAQFRRHQNVLAHADLIRDSP